MNGQRIPRPAGIGAALVAALTVAGPAAAEIRIELNGVDGASRANVLAYLSLQRYATLEELPAELVERLMQRAPGEIADALRPFGYYAPKVETTLAAAGRDWTARLAVTPGAAVMLTRVDVALHGAGADEPFLRELVDAAPLRPGQQLDHGAYDRLKGELQRRATASGYLDARFTAGELLVDPARLTASATLALETGPRYRFGTVIIDQDALEPRHVRRYLRFREGDWYDAAALLATQFALDDTQYFRIVAVLPGDRDAATLTVPVRIDARRNKRNRYSVGVGYQTDLGPRARFAWDDRLVNRSGHRLRLETSVAAKAQALTIRYALPTGDPALEKAQLDLTVSSSQLADARVRTLALRPSLTRVFGRWQRVGFVDLVRTESVAGGIATRDTLVVPGISLAPVPPGFSGSGTLAADTSGLFAEVIGSTPSLGSGANFLRVRVRDDWRWSLLPRLRLLARAELGATLVHNFDDFPAQYRFFAGGDRSVRGYAFNSLSPVDTVPGNPPQQLRTGGKHLAVGSLELERDLPAHFAIAVFSDVGNAFNRFGDPLAWSAGVGLRYKLPFVSFGIDIAEPLTRRGSPRLHLNISPTFAR